METPIVVEKMIKASVAKVWNALTDKEEMKNWYFDLKEFKPEIGFEFDFMGGTEEHQYKHLCQIKAVEPQRQIAYSWRYDGYEGDTLVSFELTPAGENTRIKLTHSGLETFPNNPDFARANFVEGWNHIIGILLPEYVEE